MTTIATSPRTPATQHEKTNTTTESSAARVASASAASATATATATTVPTDSFPPAVSTANECNKSALCAKNEQVPANATCVEFLHLMKAFSESAVNVTEMAQRVESLVHQDEQLLRLLPPLQPTPGVISHDDMSGGRVSTSSSRGSSVGSVVDTTDDESSSSRTGGYEYGVDMEAMAAAMDVSMAEGMKKWHEEALLAQGKTGHDDDSDGVDMVDLDDMDMDLEVDEDDSDEGFVSDEMEDATMGDDEDDGASTDVDSTQPRISSLGDDEEEEDEEEEALHERRAQEDLQRWMELELDLDSTEDPYDASLHLPGILLTPSTVSSTTTTATTTSVANAALGVTAGSHANSSSVLSTTTATLASSKDRVRSTVFDRKSMATAALFHDDDEEDEDDDSSDLVLVNALLRKKTEAKQDAKMIDEVEVGNVEMDLHGHAIWGMEVDSYEHDLLSSIDHSVLCDRENRFLQWDLEIEAATAAAAIAAASAPASHKTTEIRTPPSSSSSASISTSVFASASADVRQKLLMATSPRDHKRTPQPLRSPSNVDSTALHFAPATVAEDWSSLDFGTFQNRTVSHILSSCLHKRKLHHPYKDRVTLVNFNVPGGEPIGPVPSHAAHLSSATGSLLFGGVGFDMAEGLFMKSGSHGLMGVSGLSATAAADPKDLKLLKSGEKKAKKQRTDSGDARKKQKLLDPFDFASASAGDDPSGFAARHAMTKLENLPLPDLTNLPQDLKELKRKIEATEHKVEGTKHRHRKGGPCPRCQVQNQLRAAKRAYHKRAVAHKKLPQLGTVSPALTATAVVVTPPPSSVPVAMPSPAVAAPSPITITAKPVVTATSISTPATTAVEAAKAPTQVDATTTLLTAASTSVTATAPATIVRQASLPTVQQLLPQAVPVASPLATAKPTAAVAVQAMKPPVHTSAATAVATPVTPTPFPRRSCSETALASPFSTPSSDGSTPSSPESASPPVHHVTVTSA